MVNRRFSPSPTSSASRLLYGVLGLYLTVGYGFVPSAAHAASSAGCEGGGFTVLGLSGQQKVSIPADTIPASFIVQGRHVQFEVVSASFGIRNYMFLPTSPLNPLDQTGGTVSPIFASKIPNHGVALMGDVDLDLGNHDIVIQRTGPGVTMKIQAKDCANGGLFQMEVERADGQKTLFTHVLADGVFYFDNPNFREREGDVVNFTPSDPTGAQQITITPRINWANDVSPTFVGRDSPQDGVPPNDTVRVSPPAGQCNNQIQRGMATL